MKGVGSPDVLAGAMDFGVVAGPDVEAVPDPSGSVLQDLAGDPFYVVAVPGAVLGEGFQGFPVVGAFQSDEGLGDGVFLDIKGQSGEPLDEAVEAGPGKAVGVGGEDGLPEHPQ